MQNPSNPCRPGEGREWFETDQKAAVTEATTLEPAIVLPFLVEEKFGCR